MELKNLISPFLASIEKEDNKSRPGERGYGCTSYDGRPPACVTDLDWLCLSGLLEVDGLLRSVRHQRFCPILLWAGIGKEEEKALKEDLERDTAYSSASILLQVLGVFSP
jgi:hypothetical protein